MKLTNDINKFLTKNNNNSKSQTKLFSSNQNVSYTTQGELIIDNKCLTFDNNDNVYFDDCSDKTLKNQSWDLNLDENKISPYNNKNKCLSSDADKLKYCDSDESIYWNTEQNDVEHSDDYNLPQYKGKSVVLVDSNNPWYLNKDITIPMNYYNNLKLTGEQYHNSAVFPPDKKVYERFTQLKKKNNECQNHVIILLFIIFLILVIYRCMKKK